MLVHQASEEGELGSYRVPKGSQVKIIISVLKAVKIIISLLSYAFSVCSLEIN